MISGILLPFTPWSGGTRTATTSAACCPGCPHISATSNPPIPIGTSPPHRNCWRLPPGGSNTQRGNGNDRDRTDSAEFLHRAAGQTTPGQPAHDGVLPQHLPAAAAVRPATNRQTTSLLDWDNLGVDVIAAFLDDLEGVRGNSPARRNTRLAAVRSLFRFAVLRHPDTRKSSSRCWPSPKKLR